MDVLACHEIMQSCNHAIMQSPNGGWAFSLEDKL
jgi:hypothetical protein